MKTRIINVVNLLICSSFILPGVVITNNAHAETSIAKPEQQQATKTINGTVTDVFVASVYTYAEVDTGEMKVWAAGPVTPLKVGDKISFSTRMPMKNFHSDTLKRDFPILYFVDKFNTTNETTASNTGEIALPHSNIVQKQAANPVKGIEKVKGGNTIAEIYANKDSFKGKTIRVRGKVTKFNSNILGKHWLHIMDSSTHDDLTVTTDSIVATGDIVIVEGKIELEKDYGYGYVYPVIMEDAKITKE